MLKQFNQRSVKLSGTVGRIRCQRWTARNHHVHRKDGVTTRPGIAGEMIAGQIGRVRRQGSEARIEPLSRTRNDGVATSREIWRGGYGRWKNK